MWATYLIGPALSLLPQAWRKEIFSHLPIQWKRAAFISGLVEVILFLPLLVLWFRIFAGLFLQAWMRAGSPDDVSDVVGIVWFWINPITWLVVYVGIEGIVRAVAALTVGEARGSAVLLPVYYLYRRSRERQMRAELPLVADEITPGDASCDIKVSSCRQKPEWNYPYTIHFAGTYFQVIGFKDLGAGPRPYTYLLRRLPLGEPARGLQEYHAEDVLVPRGKLDPNESQS